MVRMNLASFDVMCASCHGPQIRDLDAPSAAQLHDLIFVKSGMSQTDQGPASPFMELMLGNKTSNSDTIARLIDDLADDGEETMRRRLHMVCDQSTDSASIEACVRALEESHFFDAVAALRQASQAEPVAGSIRNDSVRYGNWRVMPGDRTLAYDCNKHADPVLQTLIDLLARNAAQYPAPPAKDHTGVFDRFLRDMIAPESTGRCLKCHSIVSVSEGGLRVNWQTQHGHRSSQQFTHFSHKPHLTLLSSQIEVNAVGNGQKCETCHTLNYDSFDLVNHAFRTDDGMPNSAETRCSALGVNSTQRQNCAQCHTQTLAGDNCLQCHNYHAHETTRTGPSP